MSHPVSFFVAGEAKPKGSMRGFQHRSTGRVIVTHDNSRTKDWQQLVALRAQDFWPDGPCVGAVAVVCKFVLKRPKGHYGTGRNEGKLKQNAPTYHTKKPDIDKLARTVLDALKGIVWTDDSQVSQLVVTKWYVPQDDRIGIHLTVRELQ